MAEVRWSLTAEADLRAIEDFIAQDSVLHAVDLEGVEHLSDAPRMGRVVPEFQREDLRELLFRAYRVVYQVRGEMVTVLRVVHAARDLARLVRREPWVIE